MQIFCGRIKIKGRNPSYGLFQANIKVKEAYGIKPPDSAKPYSMEELLKCIVDGGELIQYKEGYGKTIICAYARE